MRTAGFKVGRGTAEGGLKAVIELYSPSNKSYTTFFLSAFQRCTTAHATAHVPPTVACPAVRVPLNF